MESNQDDHRNVDGKVEEQFSPEIVQLAETVADIPEWFENGEEEQQKALAFGAVRNVAEEVLDQINHHSGKKIIFVGRNGIGKSWILNMLLMLTVTTPSEYTKANKNPNLDPAAELVPNDYVKNEDEDSDFADLRSNLEGYSDGDAFSPSSFNEFLLPSKPCLRSTTRTLVHILHGPIFRCVVVYLTEQAIKENAWGWVMLNQEVSDARKLRTELHTKQAEKLREFFEKVVEPSQHFEAEAVEWLGLNSEDDLQLQQRVKDRAGQKREFTGGGKSLHADRQWIREKLFEVATDKDDGIIQDEVCVYVPCKIVADCSMITDSPGTRSRVC